MLDVPKTPIFFEKLYEMARAEYEVQIALDLWKQQRIFKVPATFESYVTMVLCLAHHKKWSTLLPIYYEMIQKYNTDTEGTLHSVLLACNALNLAEAAFSLSNSSYERNIKHLSKRYFIFIIKFSTSSIEVLQLIADKIIYNADLKLKIIAFLKQVRYCECSYFDFMQECD